MRRKKAVASTGAWRWLWTHKGFLRRAAAANQSDIARREGIPRARVTQVMGMLRLAPEIQQHVLSMPEMVRRPAITERALRPIAQIVNPEQRIAKFEKVVGHAVSSSNL